jgi:hypothetical protein
LNRSQYRVEHFKSERMTLMMYYLGFAKVDSFDPTGEFKKIDQVLPEKKGEMGKDHAKDIESALDWCTKMEV